MCLPTCDVHSKPPFLSIIPHYAHSIDFSLSLYFPLSLSTPRFLSPSGSLRSRAFLEYRRLFKYFIGLGLSPVPENRAPRLYRQLEFSFVSAGSASLETRFVWGTNTRLFTIAENARNYYQKARKTVDFRNESFTS